ncbi:heme ABC transporter ATP-binding protein [Clostridium sp. CX1]|uniref:Heme ABC transporter ATP-binding protein n=1 Tax=Clostridium tanneri TaxID=3037988 RepID=A0ABU4JTG0_9CLOT|nr:MULTISPECIES: heme ABC transporter ATP-binding protein [unclassified Clostridium]MCT8978162.1 heme ABC transporter ATP-binding protein [Clostridium sp. CX1]MDW8801224.1 heme ABC transporter ATP-binding protein [Clostridium sp. A1-XYC3]
MTKPKAYSVQVQNLDYSYEDKKILQDININFKENKFYSIIGPNGSGKTTFIKNLSKILEPKKNSILIEDKDIISYKNKELAKKVSTVPQNTILDFDFSALDIVLMGRSPYISRLQSENDKDMELVKNAMEMTNTWQLREKNISSLSGGEQQRVLIARALAQDTKIILLDEPISHLDLYHQVELLDTIKFLNRDITIITVLHDLNLAAQYSDEILLMSKGRIISQGSPEEVITKKNIKEVYNMDVHLLKNPSNGRPHIIPISKSLENKKELYAT